MVMKKVHTGNGRAGRRSLPNNIITTGALLSLLLVYVNVVCINPLATTHHPNHPNETPKAWPPPIVSPSQSQSQKLELRAYHLMKENAKKGLSVAAVSPIKHYSITNFQLSPEHDAGYTYEVNNAVRPSILLNHNAEETTKGDEDKKRHPTASASCIERIICRISKSINNRHFAHFAQDAFPCFSALQQEMRILSSLPTGKSITKEPTRFIMQLVIPTGAKMTHFHTKWNTRAMQAFKKTGIEISTIRMDNDGVIMGDSNCDWIVNIKKNDVSGWSTTVESLDPRDGKNVDANMTMNSYPIQNAKYFSMHQDMEILQRAVLTTEFHHGPSNTLPIRVLIIDRAKKSRHWLYAAETKTQLKAIWGNDGDVIVKIVSNPGGALLKQARLFHSADIIISSHGAQLTNLAFIRPCTVVVEIFPYAYYLGFFQTLVLAAEGIAFDANPFDSSPRVDTQRNSNEKDMRRRVSLQASPVSVVHAFPRLLLELMTCRRNWKAEEGGL